MTPARAVVEAMEPLWGLESRQWEHAAEAIIDAALRERERALLKLPDDPARAIATMLGKLDDADKATLNGLFQMFRRHGERATWRAASELARAYFDPCDEPADISARECGEQIAAALAARGEG